jgi:Avidin family
MKKIIATVIIVIFVFIGLVSPGYADSNNQLQTFAWTNQSGSTLYIDQIINGQLTGRYINRAPGYKCQNIPYPVTGWIYETAITFTTKWISATESCNSITAWTGFFYNNKIETLWQLVMNDSSSTGQILTGSDTFSPSPTKNYKSLNERINNNLSKK